MIGIYIKNELFYEGKYKEINDMILELIDKKFFEVDFNYNEFINHVLSDKKNKGDNICLILLSDIGKSIFIYKKKEEIDINIKNILKKLFRNYID